jgi:hypothetical protein
VLSRYEFGRVIALSSYSILSSCSDNNETHILFITNFLRWAGGPAPRIRLILIYGLPDELSERLVFVMRGLGFGFEVRKSGPIDFDNYITIFIQSDCPHTDGLRSFLAVGGCVVCAPAPEGVPNRFCANAALAEAGVGFPDPPFDLVPSQETSFELVDALADLRTCVFSDLCKTFLKQFKDDAFILKLLAAHVSLLKVGQSPDFAGVLDGVMAYVFSLNVLTNSGLEISQKIFPLVELLVSGFPRLAANQISCFDLSEPFPGSWNSYLEEVNVTLDIATAGWLTTGVWVPPGTVAHIALNKDVPPIVARVGAYTADLWDLPMPWKRWPVMSLCFGLAGGDNEVATPFGGMLYIEGIPDFPKDKPSKLLARVMGAAKYPLIRVKKEDSWAVGEDTDCPMVEIFGRFLIFTIPTNQPDLVPAMIECINFLDDIVKSVHETLGLADGLTPIRIVFDVHPPPEGAICGYPIVLGRDWMTKLLEKPIATVDTRRFAAMVAHSDLSDAECPEVLGALIAILVSTTAVRQPAAVAIPKEVLPLWEQLTAIGIAPLAASAAGFRGSRSGRVDPKTQVERFAKEVGLKRKGGFQPLMDGILKTAAVNLTATQLIVRS